MSFSWSIIQGKGDDNRRGSGDSFRRAVSVALWGICLFLLLSGAATLVAPDWLAALSRSEKAQTALRFEQLGREALEKGDIHAGVGYFNRALEIDPGLGDGLIGLGLAAQMLGDNDGAITYYNAGLANNPVRPDRAYGNLGVIFAKRGEFDKAVSFYLEGARAAPEPTGGLISLGQVYVHLNKPDSAIIVLEEALKKLGDIAVAYRAALAFAGEFYRFDPEVVGQIAERREEPIGEEIFARYDMELFRRGRMHAPEAFSAHRHLAEAYATTGDFDRCLFHLESALAIDPENAFIRKAIGEISKESSTNGIR